MTISANYPWKDALRAASGVSITFAVALVQLTLIFSSPALQPSTGLFVVVSKWSTELEEETNMHDEVLQWANGEWSCTAHIVESLLTQDSFLSDFRQRSSKRLKRSGDTALNAQRFDEAISDYTIALSLNPPSRQDILVERNKAYTETESWKLALDHANEVLCFFPPSCFLPHHP